MEVEAKSLSKEFNKSSWQAVKRSEHFQEMFQVSDEELRLLLDAKYMDREYHGDTEKLPESERYWELLVYGASTEFLGNSDADLSFKYELSFPDIKDEDFLGVVYPSMVESFEERYGGCVDALLYFEPENLEYYDR